MDMPRRHVFCKKTACSRPCVPGLPETRHGFGTTAHLPSAAGSHGGASRILAESSCGWRTPACSASTLTGSRETGRNKKVSHIPFAAPCSHGRTSQSSALRKKKYSSTATRKRSMTDRSKPFPVRLEDTAFRIRPIHGYAGDTRRGQSTHLLEYVETHRTPLLLEGLGQKEN